MQVNPYLMFNGQCEAAFKFYHQVLGGELGDMMTFAGSPAEAEVPPEFAHKIMHTQLTLDDWAIMGSDCTPEHYDAPQDFSVSLQIPDPDKAEQIFQALAESGTIQMPWKKPSGRSGLAWWSTNSAFPG